MQCCLCRPDSLICVLVQQFLGDHLTPATPSHHSEVVNANNCYGALINVYDLITGNVSSITGDLIGYRPYH